MGDTFMRAHIKRLTSQVRTQGFLKFIKPYTRLKISFIAEKLNIPDDEVETLLVKLILDGKINGHIDQVRAWVQAIVKVTGSAGIQRHPVASQERPILLLAGTKDAGNSERLLK